LITKKIDTVHIKNVFGKTIYDIEFIIQNKTIDSLLHFCFNDAIRKDLKILVVMIINNDKNKCLAANGFFYNPEKYTTYTNNIYKVLYYGDNDVLKNKSTGYEDHSIIQPNRKYIVKIVYENIKIFNICFIPE
jgi:hypothetical protein